MTAAAIRHTDFSRLTEKFSIRKNVPLKEYTTFKVGGPADMLSLPETKNELEMVLAEAAAMRIPVTLFGGGTNILISDKGIRGLVIVTRRMKSEILTTDSKKDSMELSVLSGQRLSSVCRFAVENGLEGLEFAAGIPGTIGGAVMMNAGTPSGQISDVIKSVEMWKPDSRSLAVVDRSALKFSYRNLDLNAIITAVNLTLKKGEKTEIEKRFARTLKNKKDTQPVSHASAGCFFKNPDNEKPAGWLIEKAGLKGERINDAMVSERHANYIVNLKSATCSDILLLKEKIQKTVFEKFGINLETEVRIEGE